MDICPYQLANKFLNVKFEMSGYNNTTNIASFDKSICLYLNVKIWAKSNVKINSISPEIFLRMSQEQKIELKPLFTEKCTTNRFLKISNNISH